jgi:hypothetical protein
VAAIWQGQIQGQSSLTLDGLELISHIKVNHGEQKQCNSLSQKAQQKKKKRN